MEQWLNGQTAPIFWLVLSVILAAAEGLSAQLFAIWFALGAVVAAFVAVLGVPAGAQITVFLIVSAAALIATRPFVKNVLKMKSESTNADRVIGETGIVIQEIDNDRSSGRVQAMGLDWAARTQDNSRVPVGEKVKVQYIEGVTLVVKHEP